MLEDGEDGGGGEGGELGGYGEPAGEVGFEGPLVYVAFLGGWDVYQWVKVRGRGGKEERYVPSQSSVMV